MKDNNRKDRKQELDVSEEAIELALNRLLDTVKGEEIPAVWLEQASASGAAKQQGSDQTAKEAGSLLQYSRTPASAFASSLPNPAIADPAVSSVPNRRMKKRWLSGATAAVVAGLLLFSPWGQNVMASMLSTFRVQHFETISFSESDLSGFRQALTKGTNGTRQLDLERYGEIEQQGGGESRTVDQAEAASIAGHPLKLLPGADYGAIKYQPQQELIFKLHPKEINTMIAYLGGTTKFPDSIDNQPIKLHLPGTLTMVVREDASHPAIKQLVQLQSPTLDVPEDVDLEQVRQAVLDLPMLPDDIRTQLAGIGDWRTTLPIPSFSQGGARKMTIEGNEAILLTVTDSSRSLIWLQDNWVYQLTGTTAAYPSDDTLITEAKGLMKS